MHQAEMPRRGSADPPPIGGRAGVGHSAVCSGQYRRVQLKGVDGCIVTA